MVMPLITDADLEEWRAVALAYRGHLRNAELGELLRYRDAALALSRYGEASTALRSLINISRHREPGGTVYLQYADELSMLLRRLPPAERSAAHGSIANAKTTAGLDVQALYHRVEALKVVPPDSTLARLTALGNLSSAYGFAGDTIAARKTIYETMALTATLTDTAERLYNLAYDYSTLGSFHRTSGQTDSARYYLRGAIAAVAAFPPHLEHRKRELRVVGLDAATELASLSPDSEAALASVDSLRLYSPKQALLHEVRIRKARKEYDRAYEILAAATFRTDRRRKLALRELIGLAQLTGHPEAAIGHATALADLQSAISEQAQTALTDMSQSYLAAFERERAAVAERHAGELHLLRSRQRMLWALLATVASLALAAWAYRRSRESSALSADLSDLVEIREADLRVANAALERQLAEVEEFNHLLSHDLREPLRSISGFSQILGRRISAVPELAADFAYLRAGIDQLRHLHAGVERLRRGKERAPVVKPVDLHVLLRQLVAEYRGEAPEADLHLEIRTPTTRYRTDAFLVETVLRELISNALKFSAEGRPRVWVDLFAEEGGPIAFAVEDAGIGIETAYRDTVFEAFKRLNRREQYPGAGIGLALVRVAVEKVGGEVRIVDGARGRGARFEVAWPHGGGARGRMDGGSAVAAARF